VARGQPVAWGVASAVALWWVQLGSDRTFHGSLQVPQVDPHAGEQEGGMGVLAWRPLVPRVQLLCEGPAPFAPALCDYAHRCSVKEGT
jgi:hypothetical protein